MKYYPVCLNLKGKKVLLSGGGRVAFRKAKTLLASGALVTVVAEKIAAALEKLPGVEFSRKKFEPGDLTPAFTLAIAATSSKATNRLLAQRAGELHIPVNVVDDAELSSFILPALVKKGELQLAISTSGIAPGFAAWLRKELETMLPPQLDKVIKLLGELRKNSRYGELNAVQKRDFWGKVHNLKLLENVNCPSYLKLKKSIEELWKDAG